MSRWLLHGIVWTAMLIIFVTLIQLDASWADCEEVIWFGIYLSFFIEICSCVKKPFFVFSFAFFSLGLLLDILDSYFASSFPIINVLDTPIKHIGLILICYCLLRIAKSRLSKIEQLRVEIERRITLEKDLRFLAYHDELTGLFNRRAFFEHFEQQHFDQAYLYYFDLNNFKNANDKYGHHIGDELLATFSHSLSRLYPNDKAYRLGGDEFVLICSELIDDIELFKQQLDQPLVKYMVSVSVGMQCLKSGDDPDHALHLADQKMYIDKEANRSRFIVNMFDFQP
ncbi:hypothetical protein PULV_b0749 [Pseudoalteromonas ulvae UL12]|uniref:diguanylate cyclase n=1 Tax=Pseudoalteromonas ulvae TaxID=107327 RepID=A0A244CRM5_PSEDV|nr:GGDEF domain-containing protein [Pseudoalteromonas ulvae]MBE0366023.1 hypothetical protein [Pseudoalteromonas ulvae UL12]OUL58244.1 hypothetical protein B1199_07790 [Pseudoalteromonas ulvae]